MTESEAEPGSDCEPESGAAYDSETESEAESDVVSQHMRTLVESCSAPAAVNMGLLVKPEGHHHLGISQVRQSQQEKAGD